MQGIIEIRRCCDFVAIFVPCAVVSFSGLNKLTVILSVPLTVITLKCLAVSVCWRSFNWCHVVSSCQVSSTILTGWILTKLYLLMYSIQKKDWKLWHLLIR